MFFIQSFSSRSTASPDWLSQIWLIPVTEPSCHCLSFCGDVSTESYIFGSWKKTHLSEIVLNILAALVGRLKYRIARCTSEERPFWRFFFCKLRLSSLEEKSTTFSDRWHNTDKAPDIQSTSVFCFQKQVWWGWFIRWVLGFCWVKGLCHAVYIWFRSQTFPSWSQDTWHVQPCNCFASPGFSNQGLMFERVVYK